MKRILYGLTMCGAIGYAYIHGLAKGRKDPTVVDSVEEDDTEIIERTEDKNESEDESEMVNCDDPDCSRKFDNEHGKNIHMGIAHE